MKKIINIFIDILVIIAIGIVVTVLYINYQIKIQNKSYANIFGYTMFVVKSGSMEPTISTDDIILVKIQQNDLNVNDIISYEEDNMIITHRIIEVQQNDITTKGDNNNTQDGLTKREKVIGKVIKIIHNVGIWKKVFKTKEVLGSLAITIILLIISITIKTEGEKK